MTYLAAFWCGVLAGAPFCFVAGVCVGLAVFVGIQLLAIYFGHV